MSFIMRKLKESSSNRDPVLLTIHNADVAQESGRSRREE
jgi:hypothetical protein